MANTYASSTNTTTATPNPLTTATLQTSYIQHLVSVKLDCHNYLLWTAQFILLLKGYRLYGFADGTNTCPPETTNDNELQLTILSGLDSAYDAVVTALTASLEHLNMYDFQAQLNVFEMRLEAQQQAL
ncbi:hypothetical protein BVC80_8571g11 [Macleaya cordata]|uniref:Uncharacterized protein n=1 Tax=Macleaya cordata TaxID=56857 RepID=A0A200QM18_MACCD|nr:hypothetical protein BVC80_8571g11 [Macleaya cordata]